MLRNHKQTTPRKTLPRPTAEGDVGPMPAGTPQTMAPEVIDCMLGRRASFLSACDALPGLYQTSRQCLVAVVTRVKWNTKENINNICPWQQPMNCCRNKWVRRRTAEVSTIVVTFSVWALLHTSSSLEMCHTKWHILAESPMARWTMRRRVPIWRDARKYDALWCQWEL